MIRRAVVLLFVVLVLTACSGSEPISSAGPAPARDDTVEELKAALPTADDVDGARAVTTTCPDGGSERCGTRVSEGQQVSRFLELSPVTGTSSADVERAEKDTLLDDIVFVSAWKHETDAAAKKSIAMFRSGQEMYEGSYDIEQERGEGRVSPALAGTGTIETLTLGEWSGLIGNRRGTLTFDDQTEGRVASEASVRSGAYAVVVTVEILREGRPDGHAEKLAREVLGDYLERLG
ncbi:hypothetical protein C6I20_12720 [Aeromicrobium sp. A1-2]|uniref:hypothetical protein n=1 Tax=Aeromicrobium sp. A1-2 TaxID=2107713 RepID=UPI000E4D3A36|nr:hypothetical protein [Aeromicrobium sp. A1-2]AXT85959.1 hypothetical protein C6I20_12720 [Aeromicrobium sp. A1-2]